MKKVVVTGANSFIGKHLIAELLRKGYFVYAVVRKEVGKPISENFKYIISDMDNYDSLSKKINDKCFAFFHLAWDGTRGKTRLDEKLQEKNYINSLKTVECAKEIGCRLFIGAGSQAEYGVLDKQISEEDIPQPNTAYGKYKLAFTNYLLSEKTDDFLPIIPRFFSLFGENDNSQTIIESTLDKMLRNEDCDFTLADQYWNFMYIKDCVKAMIYLMEHNCYGIYNFATDDTRRLKDFIIELKEITKSSSALNFGVIPYPENGKVSIQPNIDKLKSTGFANFTSFNTAIENIIKNKRTMLNEKN